MPKVVAYVLALASAGSEHDVCEQIKKISDVVDAKVCYGAWDIVVTVETESFGKLDAVVTKIRKLPNIEQTTTLVATWNNSVLKHYKQEEDISLTVSDSARGVLKKYGLSEYESKAYATLVQLGSASVREICKVAGIPQPRAYDTLAKLESKGLVETQEGRPVIYRAVPPKDAFDRLEKGLKAQTALAVEEFASRYGYERSSAEMWTIKGETNIINKIEEMIDSGEEQLLLAVPTEVLEKIKPTVEKAISRSVEATLMVSQRGNPKTIIPVLENCLSLTRKDDIPAILVLVDRKEALMSSGCISNYKGPWLSVWTNEPSFVELVSLFFAEH